MAFNHCMHPRSVFKIRPPNFKQLATKYAFFKEVCYIGVGGKVSIDFKNPEAVRSFSRALLLDYFELDVEFPSEMLVPRIPQRLNYLLLLEDLLEANALSLVREVCGIDIGIFPLIGARLNGWKFCATDIDQFALNCAKENVDKNSLGDKICVVISSPTEYFKRVMELSHFEKRTFTFCMCNPPFFDPEEGEEKFFSSTLGNECLQNNYSDSGRLAPRSATHAKSQEVFVEGGEIAFVKAMMHDSWHYKDRIRICTSMVGKRSSIAPLQRVLQSIDPSTKSAIYSLSQGRTKRWVIAWTFATSVNLPAFDYMKS